MKRTPWFLVALLALAVAEAPAMAAPKTVSTWADPNLMPSAKQKVLVLAMVQEEVNKRVIEDSLVKALVAKKIEAVPAYSALTHDDLASADTLRAKAKSIGVDAGIVIRVTGQNSHVEAVPAASVSVGVGGMFGGFIGTSMPVGGGTKTVHNVSLKSEYYRAEHQAALWMGTYSVQMGADVQAEADSLSKTIMKQLKKAKAIQ